MKTLKFKFLPQDIRIDTEEIRADLDYPASAGGRRNGRKVRQRRPRAPR